LIVAIRKAYTINQPLDTLSFAGVEATAKAPHKTGLLFF